MNPEDWKAAGLRGGREGKRNLQKASSSRRICIFFASQGFLFSKFAEATNQAPQPSGDGSRAATALGDSAAPAGGTAERMCPGGRGLGRQGPGAQSLFQDPTGPCAPVSGELGLGGRAGR